MIPLSPRISSIVLASLLFLVFSCGNNREKILPTKTRITESVYSSVTIQPDSLYQVYSAVAGILEKNLVEEGDTVERGSPILQIINKTPKLNAQNAQLNLQLARENYSGNNTVLKGLRDEIQAAELKKINDSINFFRQKNLWEQRIGSQVEYENRKLAFELATKNLQLLKNSYERVRKELKTKLQQAENNYASTLITTNDFRVTSKINGKVYGLFKNPGELVSTIEPLASIGSSDTFLVEMLVDEVDIVKLKEGQQTLITLDAYDNELFEASVRKIYPRKDERTQTFKIEAVFTDPPAVLYPGLAGEGNIIIAQKEDVLTIPRAYIIGTDQVETEDGLVQISLGLQDLERAEVLSGLDANTYILKPKE